MSSIPALSPLTTSSQPNASIIFRGETFPIFKQIFTSYSRTAAAQDHPSHSVFVITSQASRESVQIFVDICQGKPAPFDKSQILDLLSLSEEWSVDSLKSYLLTLIENDDNQILTSLRYAIEKDFQTGDYEARARRRFSELIDKDEVFGLPLSVLRRIVDLGLQDTDFDKLFGFLRKCLDRFGSSGSVLFEGVNLRHFSIAQIQELIDRRGFNWCYLSGSAGDTLSVCISEMAKHRTRFEEEHRALCDLQVEYRRAVSDYETAQRAQNDRLSSVEASLAALQSSLESRLRSVESNYPPRSEVEAKSAEKSDLAANYATKSLLQTTYLTKSDIEQIYVQKSELEANYATKSVLQTTYLAISDFERVGAQQADLEQNYAKKSELQLHCLTKAGAKSLEGRCASKAFVEAELRFLKAVTTSFSPTPGPQLNGIIRHLTLECGGNVHDFGVVSVTANRPICDLPHYAARNVVDLDAQSGFDCENELDMCVCYDFQPLKVVLTDYAIRSNCACGYYNLKSWVVEVSNDGANWTEADRRENRDELCATDVVCVFTVSKPSVGSCVRLRQIGRNDLGIFRTVISAWELFGALTR
jgi:hypothetical protein